jgi:acyl-CoA-binding protein
LTLPHQSPHFNFIHLLPQDFDAAADQVKKLKASPSNDDLLILYSLFKQATVGDNNTGAQPSNHSKSHIEAKIKAEVLR